MRRPSHSKKDPAAADEFRQGLAGYLENLRLPEGSKVKLWMMDEARFGLHTETCRLWALKGKRPVVTRQIKYEWDYLYGSLDVLGGQAGFHLCDGDARLPERVRIIDLPPYNPELNPCEQLWDRIKDEIGNRIFATVEELREATLPALLRYWDDAAAVLRLVGRCWLLDQVNTSNKTVESH